MAEPSSVSTNLFQLKQTVFSGSAKSELSQSAPAHASSDLYPRAWTLLVRFAAARVLLHFISNGFFDYGLFRDEFYYISCANHLAWGYVDHPPLSIFLLAVQTALFGDGVFSLRIIPSLAGGVLVILSGLLARELGADRFGQAFTAAVVAFTHTFIAFAGFYSMNALDLVFWAAILYVYILITRQPIPEPGLFKFRFSRRNTGWLWILLGALFGLGLLNKLSVLWLGAGLGLGMLLTWQRNWLRTPWPWIAAAIAGLIFVPHIVWQLEYGRPTAAFIHNATRFKHATFSPLNFSIGVLMYMNPLLLPIWLGGMIWLFVGRGASSHRWLGWAMLFVIGYLTLSGSAKPYYPVLAFPPLAAAAGAATTSLFRRQQKLWRLLIAIYITIVLLIFLPFSTPLMPPQKVIDWSYTTGITMPSGHRGKPGGPPKHVGGVFGFSALGQQKTGNEIVDRFLRLPPYFGGCFGWKEVATTVEEAYLSLSPVERQQARVITFNYSEAGSLQYYSTEYSLPPVYSGHNNFWFWPPESFEGITLTVGFEREKLEPLFQEVELAAMTDCDFCIPAEDDVAVFICRGPKLPFNELWREFRLFI